MAALGLVHNGWLYIDLYEYALGYIDYRCDFVTSIRIALPSVFSQLALELCTNLTRCKGRVRVAEHGLYFQVYDREIIETEEGAFLQLYVE